MWMGTKQRGVRVAAAGLAVASVAVLGGLRADALRALERPVRQVPATSTKTPAAVGTMAPATKAAPRIGVPAPARRLQRSPWNLNDPSTWPAITEVSPSTCIRPGSLLTVKGKRFGAKGHRGPSLQLGVAPEAAGQAGAPTNVSGVVSWTDSSVAFAFPRVAGVEPGARATVAFSLKGRVLASESVQVCAAKKQGAPLTVAKKMGTSGAPVAAKISPAARTPLSATPRTTKPPAGAMRRPALKVASPEPTTGGAAPEARGRALRSPVATARRAARGGVFLVRTDRELMSRVTLGRRKVDLRIVRHFEIPQTHDGPPSETPPEFAPIEGDIDPLQDAGPKASECPEGDPNCPDVPQPGDGVTDPPEWQVDVGSGCPPGSPGCGIVVVKVWPDGDPMPGDDPDEEIDCTKIKLPGTKFCGFIIDLEKPDPLGDPLASDDDGDATPDPDAPPPCDGDVASDEACQTCTGNDSGDQCVTHEVEDLGGSEPNEYWEVEWTEGYQNDDGSPYKSNDAENDAEAASGKQCHSAGERQGTGGTSVMIFECS